MKMPRRMRKEQLDKVSSKIGIVRKLKMRKRRKRMTGRRKNQMEVQWDEDRKLEGSHAKKHQNQVYMNE